MDPLKTHERSERDPTERLVRQLQTLSNRVSGLEQENKALKRALYDLSAAYARAGGARGQRRFVIDPEESTVEATAEEVEEVSEEAVAHAGHGHERERRDPRLFFPKYELLGHTGAVYVVRYAPDGRLLASGSFDRSVRLWDGPSEVMCMRKHTLPITDLVWSPGENASAAILSAGLDKTCRLWDVRLGKVRETFETDGVPQAVGFHQRDPHMFGYGGSRGAIGILDDRTGSEAVRAWRHTSPISSLHFCRDGHGLMTADGQGRVCLWDTRTGEMIRTLDTDTQPTPISYLSVLHGHHANDPDHVAVTGFDDHLRIYQGRCEGDRLDLRPLHPLLPPGYHNRSWPIRCAFFEGRDYTAPSMPHWQQQQQRLLQRSSTATSPTRSRSSFSSQYGSDMLGGPERPASGRGLEGEGEDWEEGDRSGGGVGGSSPSTIGHTADEEMGDESGGHGEGEEEEEEEEEDDDGEEEGRARLPHREAQKSLDTSLFLATGSAQAHVCLYDVGGVEGSASLLQRLEGHKDRVYAVDFSPREPLLASGSADMSIRLWSPAQRARHKVDGI